jgi:hypothetical protein
MKMLGLTSLCLAMFFTTTLSIQTESVSASTPTDLSPIADSYVNSGAVSTNYGMATSMVTKESAANDRSAYLKFDLSGLTGSVSSATLRLYVKSLTAVADRIAYSVSTDTWTESGLTYSNRPAFGNPAGSVRVFGQGWVEFDVTSYVMSEYAGDKNCKPLH